MQKKPSGLPGMLLALSMKMKCKTFASTEEFLDRYDSSLTGCALVDFRLRGMNGLQLQERLRTMGSSLALILVSAYASVSMVVHAMKNGALAVIEKPYKSDDLADMLRQAMVHGARMKQSADNCGRRMMKAALERMLNTEMDVHLGRKISGGPDGNAEPPAALPPASEPAMPVAESSRQARPTAATAVRGRRCVPIWAR